MDPVSAFGVAAGVVQFADLAANVYMTLFTYFRSVKQAPKRSEELQKEALSVSNVIDHLKSILETTNTETVNLSASLKDTLSECSQTLTEMNNQVAVKESEWGKRLKWPFTEKENLEYLSKLERYKSTFSLELDIIQRYILLTNS